MFKILMTYSSKEGLEKLFSNSEFNVTVIPKPSAENLLEAVKDTDAMLIRSEVKITKDVFDAAKNLKLVVRAGTGVDNIDKNYATQKGVVVMNVPGGNTISACEHTLAMIMSLLRNIPTASQTLKGGKWEKEKFVGTEFQGKTLGLIGLGRIGREVAKRALSFEARVIAYDPYLSQEAAKSIGVEMKTLDEVFRDSDIISLHTPLNESTKNIINKDSIYRMKNGVRLVNCARGGVIDENALLEALKEGKIKAAALDVFEKEPLPADSPLLGLNNLILTPHLGASTEEAQVKISKEASDMIIDFFTTGVVRNAVNLPSLDSETFNILKPYLELSEKLGLLQAQIIEGGLKSVELIHSGEIISKNTSFLTSAYLKGLLTPFLDIKLNFVNSSFIARERGIMVKEIKTNEPGDYTTLISATVRTENSELNAAGTVFSQKFPKIVKLKGLDVDVAPQGCMIILENIDKPGIIGKVGTILGENKINIAGMQVGRNKAGGEAVTIINTDSCAEDVVLKKITSIDGVVQAKMVVI
ncbi:MAG: phosphoglycerate dehydrogenase [Elusimicrobiota bacterium]